MEIFNHLTFIFDFKIVLLDNSTMLVDEIFDDLKLINSNFLSSNFTSF